MAQGTTHWHPCRHRGSEAESVAPRRRCRAFMSVVVQIDRLPAPAGRARRSRPRLPALVRSHATSAFGRTAAASPTATRGATMSARWPMPANTGVECQFDISRGDPPDVEKVRAHSGGAVRLDLRSRPDSVQPPDARHLRALPGSPSPAHPVRPVGAAASRSDGTDQRLAGRDRVGRTCGDCPRDR